MKAAFLDFILPVECVGCGAVGARCCPRCLAAIPTAAPLGRHAPLAAVFAGFPYAHPLVRGLIGEMKYGGSRVAGRAIEALAAKAASRFAAAVAPIGSEIFVPVPLHGLKSMERGFNQAEAIAAAAASALGLRMRRDILIRTRYTAPQVSAGEDRSDNVREAFRAAAVFGAHVVLVDDVWTTGSTMRECARTLLEAGAGRVVGLALASRTQNPPDGGC